MYITISPICQSCQKNIGHVYPIYRKALLKRLNDYTKTTKFAPNDFAATESIEMGKILDALKITKICCRTHTLSHCYTIYGIT